jgi:hypothetical protein
MASTAALGLRGAQVIGPKLADCTVVVHRMFIRGASLAFRILHAN